MFEKFNQIAGAAVTNVSRRQFLGRLGRGAMIVAGATAGLLAQNAHVEAARPQRCVADSDCHGPYQRCVDGRCAKCRGRGC